MDRDNNSNQQHDQDLLDDARYDDAPGSNVRQEEYAAGQEEWQEPPADDLEQEQPPQDEYGQPQEKRDPFADDGPLEDDYVQHAEDGHEHGEMHDEDEQQQSMGAARSAPNMVGSKPASSITKYIPYVGAGAAVLLLGFFGFQQFSSSFSEKPPEQPTLDNSWDTSAKDNQPAAQNPDTPSPPAQVAEATPPSNPAPVEPQNNATASNTMITPVATTPATPPAPDTAALESKISELTQQLDTMKQTQDQLNQKLQAATATPPAMDENSKAANQALLDRIAQLEEKLSSASSSSSKKADKQNTDVPSKASKSMRDSKASQASAEDDVDEKPVKKARKRGSTDFMAKRAARRHRSKIVMMGDITPVAARPYVGWVLRSAQPGSAWLSQGAASTDLRRVTPGDKVAGLGTIVSIHQTAGRWVVEGTQGAVR